MALTLGVSLSYDQAYETRVSGNVKYRFGGNGYRSPSKKSSQGMPVIQALTATPGNRDVRVHDARLDQLLMKHDLAFASSAPKAISEKDAVAITDFLKYREKSVCQPSCTDSDFSRLLIWDIIVSRLLHKIIQN